MNLNFHLFAIIGYIFLLIVNIKGLINNFNEEVTFVIGSIILICGFSIGIVEKIYNNRDEKLLKSKEINVLTDTPTNKIALRHILLFTFHFLNCYFPMNEGKLTLDMAALLGHSLLMFNVDNKIGNSSLLIFYLLSIIHNLTKINSNFKLLPFLGNTSMFMFFIFELINLSKK
jgi:hypothetical protein